ncbi:MAG: hypothetical protein QME40_07770 [bacterium]|nr:hypothetical protein [bacterium]
MGQRQDVKRRQYELGRADVLPIRMPQQACKWQGRKEIVHRQSDYLIVLKKQGNTCGEKEVAGMQLDGGDTSAALRGGVRMSIKLPSLTQRARENPKLRFTSLAHLLTEDFLMECFWELKRDKASGIDGVTVKGYEANLGENLKELVVRLKAKRYRPKPVRRVYIPKPNGKKRPLGITYCRGQNSPDGYKEDPWGNL